MTIAPSATQGIKGVDLSDLDKEPRLLWESTLRPVQGERFQPTGFPDLGAATFTLPTGTEMLVVESAQSVANRLEAVCWDVDRAALVEALAGLPYVRVREPNGEGYLTNSILESHRLNSPYILEGQDRVFFDQLKGELSALNDRPVDFRLLAKVVLKYDPCSLLHGLFLAKKDLAGGRLRLMRALGGFIEAREVRPVESGGVKFDRVNPSGDTRLGYGHVPFHRTEFTAAEVTAYFNLDLTALRAYALGEAATTMLIVLALWKARRFLESGLRLRTACDLDCTEVRVTRPQGFTMPNTADLEAALPQLIASCAGQFATPRITEVKWQPAKKQGTQTKAEEDKEPEETGDE